MERSNQETVIITGGQGFIGSWISKILLNENRFKVIVQDIKEDLHILKQIITDDDIKRIEFVYFDITNSKQTIDLVDKYKPSFIIHLAGLQIPTCRSNPVLGANVNVIGTINVFEAVRLLKVNSNGALVVPVIYASSAAIAGPSEDYDGPVRDDCHHQPLTMYGVFKLANEGTARVYWMDHKIPSVGLRPFTIYGVGREVGVTSATTKAIKSAIFGKNYKFPFSGKACVNYVEDIANLFIDCGKSNNINGSYCCNISGDVLDLNEWVSILKEVLPKENMVEFTIEGSSLPFPTEYTEETLEKLLGGKIKTTPPREGILKTLKIFQNLHSK
eukprot:gene2096-2583_t